ncbi:MAG: hypothetical protein M1820_004949 [Bogoriella megaspora]|nr:MAG: hypothetical protein M1820_004949 [Bogoriella megaspora]
MDFTKQAKICEIRYSQSYALLWAKRPYDSAPQRCMLYVKDTYYQVKYEAAFLELWDCLWKQHMDLSKPDQMAIALARHFQPNEVEEILAAAITPKYKEKLLNVSNELAEKGAFGAPWYFVRASDGRVEPFFGSDR